MLNTSCGKKISADTAMALGTALMLLDNTFGMIVAAAVSVYVTAIWFAVVTKMADVDAILLDKPEQLNWPMFWWNTFAALVNVTIIAFAPHNKLWMGMLLGFYVIASVLISIRFVKLINATE
tara:strand:- start:2427 stop:2792 length:366 start_codon:yes stop_codon:yes gene_type:complete